MCTYLKLTFPKKLPTSRRPIKKIFLLKNKTLLKWHISVEIVLSVHFDLLKKVLVCVCLCIRDRGGGGRGVRHIIILHKKELSFQFSRYRVRVNFIYLKVRLITSCLSIYSCKISIERQLYCPFINVSFRLFLQKYD